MKQAVCKKIHDFGLELINERREFLNKTENPTKDDEHSMSRLFLDQMMDYAKARNLSDLELSMAITDVIIAGSDTVACAIPYMIMMLALHQDIQDKVYEEIHGIFGDSNRAVEQKDMTEMVVMERVFKEVLRHCCPPHLARRVDKTIILRDVPIPVGSTLLIMLYKLHRDPQHWSHPDAFYPDHFLPENVEKRQKYTFLPFTSGQRACPGKKFSFIVVKTLMTTLLRKYKITTTVQPSEIKHIIGFMLEISDGCNVQLTPR
ncbi:cytochrome P450 4C1 [Nilaparvata lugens]|uniref:cytochrome P450 4C1 n=1 Tax=Nilaparvata lugens TaxID=108931 RepID=UPI00193C916E|nr:cytochrome P450 4C1 [Nilaparvata lugens]